MYKHWQVSKVRDKTQSLQNQHKDSKAISLCNLVTDKEKRAVDNFPWLESMAEFLRCLETTGNTNGI